MVLTKSELISSLQKEVRILLHLSTKLDTAHLDYRPTPKQRSSLELLQYLSFMGPTLIRAARAGGFDPATWTEAANAAAAADFDKTIDAIAAMSDQYASLLAEVSDADFRQDVEMFGRTQSLGSFLVNVVFAGHAAYRTQLFLYLKSCGRTELSTMNLWSGIDPPAPS